MKKRIYVLCHPLMLWFLKAIDFSKIYIEDWEAMIAALFYEEDLEKFSESKEWDKLEEKYWIWWVWCEWWALIEKEEYDFEILKENWLFSYLEYTYWVTIMSNISACISQFAYREWKTPIDFINLILKKEWKY